jgi:predicted RNA-binding Zn-ribbon protein involved in translation (DUF1610 family)
MITREKLLQKRLANLEHNHKIGEVGPKQYEFNKAKILEDLSLICPRCKDNFLHKHEVMNTLSREDNRTYICQSCGFAEAIQDMKKGKMI